MSFENAVEKGEIARNEQFLLFPQRFLPFLRTFCHFSQIPNCPLQAISIWKSLKDFVLERFKQPTTNFVKISFQIWDVSNVLH